MQRSNATRLRFQAGYLLFCCVIFLLRGTAQQSVKASDLLQEFGAAQYFWQQLDLAQKLVALHDLNVLRRLEPYLNSDDRHARGNAAFVFAGLGDKRGIQIISEIVQDRSTPRSEGQGVPAAPWSPTAQIGADRYYAAHLLGLLKDPQAVPILVPFLKDERINYKVAWSLGQIGDRSAIQPLIEALDDPSPDMRVASIEALESLGAKEALPKLHLLLQDNERIHAGDSQTVSESARSAVAKLTAAP